MLMDEMHYVIFITKTLFTDLASNQHMANNTNIYIYITLEIRTGEP